MTTQETPADKNGRPAGEQARICMARQDYRDAEKIDPSQVSFEELAEAFQRVRSSLGDLLRLLD